MQLSNIDPPDYVMPVWAWAEFGDDGDVYVGVEEYIAIHVDESVRQHLFEVALVHGEPRREVVARGLYKLGISETRFFLAIKKLVSTSAYFRPDDWRKLVAALESGRTQAGWFQEWEHKL